MAMGVMGVMGVWVGIKLAKDSKDRTHKSWWVGIIALGIVCLVATLLLHDREQREHSKEVSVQNKAFSDLKTSQDIITVKLSTFIEGNNESRRQERGGRVSEVDGGDSGGGTIGP